ncbi:hypothetical protein N780_13585 [Pontibacillus chungwhensis BH030062]|uniref:Uncharacterized protein n=1 Tax=Pontibacillus chungwhensis BH030062 TaxID=1385513 RepID=A0A0A2UXT2_9BACI|nr:hypothetical protein N780_13585 [Pontibacillus chungwhensis BH030062]
MLTSLYWAAVCTKHCKGWLGNGETPTGERGRRDPGANGVSEEARQLARGKRVVPQPPQPLNKSNGPAMHKTPQSLNSGAFWG